MKAVIIQSPRDTGENMAVADIAKPEAGADEVLVAVAYAGCNYADLMMRAGNYPHPKGYPLTGGIELAGHVAAVGDNVQGFDVGDRVAGFAEDGGAFAQYCTVPAQCLIHVPADIDLDTAAACFLQGLTAWHLVHGVGTTRAGDRVLIHAIGGGVGLYLTQIAHAAGAQVLGTVGTAGKDRRALAYGADRVVNRQDEDFEAALMAYTDQQPLDKVIDSTGAEILDRSFNLMRRLGHVISFGEAQGKPYTNLWQRLVEKSLTFTRFHLGHADFQGPLWQQGVDELMQGVGRGTIRVPLEAIYTLDNVHAMYDQLGSRQVAGKLVLALPS